MGTKKFWEKLGNWELWPFPLRYAALAPQWAAYCLRAGSPWFFTASNPTITFGGFDGEGKKEMYAQLPEGNYPKTLFITPGLPPEKLLQQINAAGFEYPFCVKPDVGLKGLLFRKIDNEAELLRYHSKMPLEYMVQDLVLLPLEVSIFYYRHPTQQKGVISGFIQKDLMEVVGNGTDTLQQLILAHPIARHRMPEMQLKHAESMNKVLPLGQQYLLAYAANLNRGARFSQLVHHIDEGLQQMFADPIHGNKRQPHIHHFCGKRSQPEIHCRTQPVGNGNLHDGHVERSQGQRPQKGNHETGKKYAHQPGHIMILVSCNTRRTRVQY